MRKGLAYFAPIALVGLGFALAGSACSATTRNTFSDIEDDAGAEGGTGFTPGPVPCNGLECKRLACDKAGEEKTSIRGKVYDPAGANPLYNVLVYIPRNPEQELPPIANSMDEGVACTTCDSVAIGPMMSTITDTNGEFVLEDVPVDKDVPVVVQVGKWRRKILFDVTKPCAENEVSKGDFRLPRNGSEGDMPHIAVTAGGCDGLECLLRGIGVDDSEFVPGHDTSGHIHVFNGSGGKFPGAPEAGGDAANAFGGELWNDNANLSRYDMVMLSCECGENNNNKGGDIGRPGARQAMWDYANAGGRIFATHFHYTWFKNSPQGDFQGVANWNTAGGGGSGMYNVDTSFPKGQAFADWLVSVNASSSPGQIQLTDVTDSLSSVQGPSQSWIMKSPTAVRYFSFNAPTAAEPAEQCGRAVYSDLHLMGISAGGQSFPQGCPAPGGLSAQQKALEFMFFDLSGCVQPDNVDVVVPK